MAKTAVVVGAGVAGLTAAWRLAQAGWQVEIVERTQAVGGLLAGPVVDGVACDLGAHRLHPQALAVRAVADLSALTPLVPRPRCGKIVLNGRHLHYPLAVGDLARSLGVVAGARLALGFAMAPRWHSRDPTADVGFAQFVIARAGRAAYAAFYRPYAEKVWGIDPGELSQSCAKQRVASAAPWRSVLRGRAKAKFLLPAGGFAQWIAALLAEATALGASLRLGHSGPLPQADAVLDSGHLGEMTTDPHLQHAGLQLVWLRCSGADLGPADTWYCPERKFWFGRVTHVGRFTADPAAQGLLCVELPQGARPDLPDWRPRLPELVDQLRQARIVPASATVTFAAQRDLPRVYPLYRVGWRAQWDRAMASACSDGKTWPIGRQGLWLHCNIDHAMATAEAAVAEIVAGRPSQAWPQVAAQFLGAQVRD